MAGKDRMLPYKAELFAFLERRWKTLLDAQLDILLYDLTSTYVEGEAELNPKAKRGYSRDGRADCLQVVLALVVTPGGFPLAYEVMDGNTADNTTLRGFLANVEQTYGQARRVWVMDRGIPTEEVLAELRTPAPDIRYLVGTPRGKSKQYEEALLELPCKQVQDSVEAHIQVAFLAYCLTVTLKKRLEAHAPGLTPRAVLEKLSTIQRLDVCLPTTDRHVLVLPRHTQPSLEQKLLLKKLHLHLPQQPPPRVESSPVTREENANQLKL